ncbi:MAG TPA: hypothetical protein PLC33_13495, partial [Niabella sp.]|nr:hypothetical protein [Niabella sp.]HRB43798.1 hypothetical protein [Niabella sp.]
VLPTVRRGAFDPSPYSFFDLRSCERRFFFQKTFVLPTVCLGAFDPSPDSFFDRQFHTVAMKFHYIYIA